MAVWRFIRNMGRTKKAGLSRLFSCPEKKGRGIGRVVWAGKSWQAASDVIGHRRQAKQAFQLSKEPTIFPIVS